MRSGDVVLDEPRRTEVADLHREVSTQVLLIDTTLLRLAAKLTDHGVPMRVLKGPSVAALYPDPLWRPYVDVDVLVPGERFDEAAALLGELGFRRRSVEVRPGFDRRFGKGATYYKDDAANVDLHRTLVAGPYAFLVGPSELFDSPAHFELSGTRLATLSPEARLIHTCISATLSDSEPKLITMRDVVQGWRDPTLDHAELCRLCAQWHIGDVVNSTMSKVNESLDLKDADALPGELAAPESSMTTRLAEWAYRGEAKRWRRQSLAAIPFVPGWADRVSYARAILRRRGLGDG